MDGKAGRETKEVQIRIFSKFMTFFTSTKKWENRGITRKTKNFEKFK
jgi:hypothetical protein